MKPDFDRGNRPGTILQSMIDQAIQEILELDADSGNNAGQDMIDLMVRFFTRPPPPARYDDIEDFLLYRHEDAAVPQVNKFDIYLHRLILSRYVLACTKFALSSSVDLQSPCLARYLRLLKDHVSVANDLGSWKKEKRAYENGQVRYMINAADVVKNFFHLEEQGAIAMTEAFQLQIEVNIDAELQRMIEENILTSEEWRFVDATIHVMSGNIFVSTVMSRYGGEACRLTDGSDSNLQSAMPCRILNKGPYNDDSVVLSQEEIDILNMSMERSRKGTQKPRGVYIKYNPKQ